MSRPSKISIDSEGIHDTNYPSVITPDSETWFNWLEQHKSFRFCENTYDGLYRSKRFTANKDSKGYWTASRKIDGRLKRKRLGLSYQLTYNKIIEVATLLRNNDLAKTIDEKYQQAIKRVKELSWENDCLKSKIKELEDKVKELESHKN